MKPKPGVQRLESLPKRKAAFIEPMDCAPVTKLADGPEWLSKLNLMATVQSLSNRTAALACTRGDANPSITITCSSSRPLAELPEGTVVDREVVALDESGRPNFNLLQNFRSGASNIHYFIFDLLVFNNRDLAKLPLTVVNRVFSLPPQ